MSPLPLLVGTSLLFVAAPARAGEPTTFPAGFILIPMDLAWQDDGILDACGLTCALLREGIQVHWIIDADKDWSGLDVTAHSTCSTRETASDAMGRDFAGGPFVVASEDAAAALEVIDAWGASGWAAVAWLTAESAELEVAPTLLVAPSIAIFEDGNEDIAWGCLNAAGIPDFDGSTWDGDSPYNLSNDDIVGADDTMAGDGALFDADGYPACCHFHPMHWDEDDNAAVTMEIRAFSEDLLSSSLFECAAAESIENDPDHGFMLSTGIEKVGISRGGATIELSDAGLELLPVDGEWEAHGGSLPDFHGTFNSDVDFVTGDDDGDVARFVATGRVDGDENLGRVSLLAGHEYELGLRYSSNAQLHGVRVFLNSCFTADCATLSMAPNIDLEGMLSATDTTITIDLDHANFGEGRARFAELTLSLDGGGVFDSASVGGAYVSGAHAVGWDLGTLVAGDSGATETMVSPGGSGTYAFEATRACYVEATRFEVTWEGEIEFDLDTDSDGVSDEDEDARGSDPLDDDTDDDGLSDGDEVDDGTDPLDPGDDGGGSGDGGITHGGTTDGGMTDGGTTEDGGEDSLAPTGRVMGGCNGCSAAPTRPMAALLPGFLKSLLVLRRRR